MSLIWATRGRTWGFRFLLDGGSSDPLAIHERMFPDAHPQPPDSVRRIGDDVALRMRDPEGRRDRSGRVIVHDFVLDGDLAGTVATIDDARRRVWPLVAQQFDEVWNRADPPASPGLT